MESHRATIRQDGRELITTEVLLSGELDGDKWVAEFDAPDRAPIWRDLDGKMNISLDDGRSGEMVCYKKTPGNGFMRVTCHGNSKLLCSF